MRTIDYFGCHVHDEFSNLTAGLDCINRLTDVVKYAKEIGMSGLAITNHDNLCEVIDINRLQKKLRKNEDDFTLAIGNEIYLVDSYHEDADGKNVRQQYYHFILIAKDKIGYQAISDLSTRAWIRSEKRFARRRVPTFKSDLEDLIPGAKGHIVATSACLGGELPKMVEAGEIGKAKAFVDWCIDLFGADDFFIELQAQPRKEQITFNKWAYENYHGIVPMIVSTDAHYQTKEDFDIFEAFMRSQQENREVQEFYEFARMMAADEIYGYLDYFPEEFVTECLNNTKLIGSQIEFYDLAQDPKIPKVPGLIVPEKTWMQWDRAAEIKEKYPTLQWAACSQDIQTAFCIHTCLNRLVERDIWNDVYLERLEEEFETMQFQSDALHDNFFAYANTMNWALDLAWSIDCAVGPSRGSASGSLLNYLMDIVILDPIKYNLPFWRYLNKTRTSPLDIDTDFQPSRRDALFEAIRAQRGELGLTQVATFGKLTLKSAINTAGRGYLSPDHPEGLDSDVSLYLSSLIEVRRGAVATLEQTLNGDEVTGFSTNHMFIKECNQYPGLLDIIKKIELLVVNSGTHAAAVILFDEEDAARNHCSLMRSPNGDLCTALDLHTVEEAGCYKYDFLLLSTLDIQATTFKLLQKDNIIDPSLTIKECFRKYINPNTIEYNNPDIWDKLYRNEVLSIFQWDAASGRKGILAAKPHNLAELTSLNGLIRLMTADGEEDQIERFVKIKADPAIFENEMEMHGLNAEQRAIMHEELDQYNGCAATQESFMVLVQKLAGFTLKQADALRKTVAKKKMNEIQFQHDLFFSNLGDTPPEVKEYLWGVIVAPSLGYGFSLLHALPYSVIGVQCVLMGGTLFNPIYWQTACLMQRSGALDDKSANHNKIAKAVSLLVKQGVNIRPVNINVSQRAFTLDAEKRHIDFGLEGVKGIKSATIDKILELRPFKSMLDCMVKTGADVTSIVALIKSGAFDEFSSRTESANILARIKCGQKEKLNGQNYAMIEREGLWPETTDQLILAKRVFNFTRYLKIISKGSDNLQEYTLNERACDFLDEIGYIHNGEYLDKVSWKYTYDVYLAPMKQYLIDHQDEMVDKLNEQLIATWTTKYFPHENWAYGEIETMGLCFAEHPYTNVENIADFDELPQEPEVGSFFKSKNGRKVPLYKLTMIAGIAIAKDKLHSSITLLTPTGPVEVKFRKQQFAAYDKQVSRKENGKKTVVERSWFNRGTGLIIHGMRQDDQFIAKTYKSSKMVHTAYKITGIKPDGKFEVQKNRKKGTLEDSDDE